MRPKYSLTAGVRTFETDVRGGLQVLVLCKLLQEAAAIHAAELGVSVESLIDGGVAWVLTRLQLSLERWPRAGEEIVIATWPEALDRLVTERRFEIADASGNVIGSATTLWLVLDLERRKPVRLPSKIVQALSKHGLGCRPIRPAAVAEPEKVDCETAYTARRSDVDLAGHVNNASYVDWLVEGVPDAVWSMQELVELDMSFLSECRRGDRIVSSCCAQETGSGAVVAHRLSRSNDHEAVVLARTVWKAVDFADADAPTVVP